MPIHVSFMRKDDGFARAAPMATGARASEAIADGATGALTAINGDFAFVVNTGSAVAYVAHGSTPDATATAETAATSARYAVPAGTYLAVQPNAGDKFATAAS